MIVLRNPIGQAYGAKEVAKSAAKKGYGPMLYDIAMNDVGGLIPDRRSVSRDAKNVWKKYMERPDIDHKKLDDVDDPKTPTEFDDAKTYNDVGRKMKMC